MSERQPIADSSRFYTAPLNRVQRHLRNSMNSRGERPFSSFRTISVFRQWRRRAREKSEENTILARFVLEDSASQLSGNHISHSKLIRANKKNFIFLNIFLYFCVYIDIFPFSIYLLF